MYEEVLKKMTQRLNQNVELIKLLSAWKSQAGLKEDEKLEVRVVVRKASSARQKKRTFIYEVLSQETWEQILSFDFWNERERIVLQNYRKAQKFGELMLSRDSALSGLVNTGSMEDFELTQNWWRLDGSINRKFKKEGLSFRSKFKGGKYGILNTRPSD